MIPAGAARSGDAAESPAPATAAGLTDFHAKYFAYELTKRYASDNVEKLASVLADAQVDLNPHQVEAALFAFRSPFSKGAILADEVGLGKTIEAKASAARDRAGQPPQAMEPRTR